MSVETHLLAVASGLLPGAGERGAIATSISTLQHRLVSHFGATLSQQIRFGSSTRDTMLARAGDQHSDVDYMTVFADGASSTPEALIARLRRFAESRYPSSEIKKSHPTVVLRLGHIMFDLVPAYINWGTYYIPAPASNFTQWIRTDPNGFNAQLTTTNKQHGSRIKPLIRLMKYWNANAGYVFNSYDLEQMLVRQSFFSRNSLREYLYAAFTGLQVTWGMALWRQERINRAKDVAGRARSLEVLNSPTAAEAEIRKLIPAL